MRRSWQLTFREELPALLSLAAPVVLSELGWMGMGVVDLIMVGPLGAEAIGAVSIGSTLFYAIAFFGMGLQFGLDTLVSQSFGAGNRQDSQHSARQGLLIALATTPVIMSLVWIASALLPYWGLTPDTARDAVLYLQALSWSTLPLLLYTTFRRYLQGIGMPRPVTFAFATANLLNWAANWALIYGHAGLPRVGVPGSGWSTTIARFYMAAVLGFAIWLYERGLRTTLFQQWPRPDPARIRELLRLGVPAALQMTMEIAVFTAATLLAGHLTAISLAAHQIALNMASVTYMVPLGVSSAGAVRVGQAIGARDLPAARRFGWLALGLGATFMLFAGLLFATVPGPLVSIYTNDPAVIGLSTSLLLIAAIFQLFDGIQTVATGVLRGAGDTRTPMIMNLLGHWVIGLPVGCLLCFSLGWGVIGLWTGLSTGLTVVALSLLFTWTRKNYSSERSASTSRSRSSSLL